MDIGEAVEKAARILREEQTRPTLGYRYVSKVWPTNRSLEQHALRTQGYTPAMAAATGLYEERKQRPRQVYEDPQLYVFQSTNFDLLTKILSQVVDTERPSFISTLLDYVRKPAAAPSALALLAEFCVRTGNLRELLAATSEPTMPTASLATMLKEIEEMIALNFNLFSDTELASMPSNLAQLRRNSELQTYSAKGPRGGGPMKPNPHYKPGSEKRDAR